MIFKKKKILTGNELTNRAEELGVSMRNNSAVRDVVPEAELQKRVIEAERAIRENNLWIIAVIAAISSLLSAFASWIAVLMCK